MMNLVILVLMIVVAAMAFVFYRRAQNSEHQRKMLPPASDGPAGLLEAPRDNVTVQNLRVGDIVSYFGQDYQVEGHLHYDEDGWTWDTYMLKDADVVRWLSVEWDDEVEVSLWEDIDLEIDATPPDTIVWNGLTFELEEAGAASVTQTGRTGRRRGVKVAFFDYESPNGRLLSVEKWGGDVEVFVGEMINAYALEIYPGDGSSFD